MAEIEKIVDPMLGENAYIIYKEGGSEAIVVDPALQVQQIMEFMRSNALRCSAILLTHGHFDHIAGVGLLKHATGAKVYIHEADAPMLTSAALNKSIDMGGGGIVADAADETFADAQNIVLSGLNIKVMPTPGHTMGSVCYFVDDACMSGDTLFAGSIGRTDFEESSSEAMAQSLQKLKEIKEEYIVHPGHGGSTSLQHEIQNNPYLGDDA